MENKKIVRYEELGIHFKRRVMLKFHTDRYRSIKTVLYQGKNTNGMELFYQGIEYLVIIDDRSIPLIEWDSFQETECEEELDSLSNLDCLDEFPDEFNVLFYS